MKHGCIINVSNELNITLKKLGETSILLMHNLFLLHSKMTTDKTYQYLNLTLSYTFLRYFLSIFTIIKLKMWRHVINKCIIFLPTCIIVSNNFKYILQLLNSQLFFTILQYSVIEGWLLHNTMLQNMYLVSNYFNVFPN